MPGRNSDEQKGRLLAGDDVEEGIELQSNGYQKEQLYRPHTRYSNLLNLAKSHGARLWIQAKHLAQNSGPYARQFGGVCARHARYVKEHGPTHLRQVKEKVWTQEIRFYLFVIVLAVLYGTASWSYSKTYRQRHKIGLDMIRGKPSALYGDLDSISAGLNVYNEVQCLKRLQSNEKWRELYFPGQTGDQFDQFQLSTDHIIDEIREKMLCDAQPSASTLRFVEKKLMFGKDIASRELVNDRCLAWEQIAMSGGL